MPRSFTMGFLLLLLAGCGSTNTIPNPSIPGQGKLILPNGQPGKFCSIHLIPVPGKPGFQCYGTTSRDGSFLLKTGEKDGLVPGTYQVVVKPYITAKTPEDLVDEIEESVPLRFRAEDEPSPFEITIASESDLTIKLK